MTIFFFNKMNFQKFKKIQIKKPVAVDKLSFLSCIYRIRQYRAGLGIFNRHYRLSNFVMFSFYFLYCI